jgi:hypothetical protein
MLCTNVTVVLLLLVSEMIFSFGFRLHYCKSSMCSINKSFSHLPRTRLCSTSSSSRSSVSSSEATENDIPTPSRWALPNMKQAADEGEEGEGERKKRRKSILPEIFQKSRIASFRPIPVEKRTIYRRPKSMIRGRRIAGARGASEMSRMKAKQIIMKTPTMSAEERKKNEEKRYFFFDQAYIKDHEKNRLRNLSRKIRRHLKQVKNEEDWHSLIINNREYELYLRKNATKGLYQAIMKKVEATARTLNLPLDSEWGRRKGCGRTDNPDERISLWDYISRNDSFSVLKLFTFYLLRLSFFLSFFLCFRFFRFFLFLPSRFRSLPLSLKLLD